MVVMTALSWAGAILASLFGTLCLACGLYYMAEFVEEYSTMTKKIISRTIQLVAAVHVLLMVSEDLPMWQMLMSLGFNLFYSLLLQNFPFIQLSDPYFIIGCVMVLLNHFTWFSFFTDHHWFQFQEVASFFLVCVWVVPFLLFVSLSANENMLPSVDPNSPTAQEAKRQDKFGNILKSLLQVVIKKKEEFLPSKASGIKAF